MLQHVGYCWLKFENSQIWANNTQHVATGWPKCKQHVGPNNVVTCCVGMLRSFGRGFRGESLFIIFASLATKISVLSCWRDKAQFQLPQGICIQDIKYYLCVVRAKNSKFFKECLGFYHPEILQYLKATISPWKLGSKCQKELQFLSFTESNYLLFFMMPFLHEGKYAKYL